MEDIAGACERLSESQDITYSAVPGSAALYVDATKWLVGLATGSFALAGWMLVHLNSESPVLLAPLCLAILSMAASAGSGVRALQCYTKLANLFEVHTSRARFEVSIRSNGIEEVRWVTRDRIARCKQIGKWLECSNFAYNTMSLLFYVGLASYVLYATACVLWARHPWQQPFSAGGR